MTGGNKQSIEDMPVKPTPRATWGVKLHQFKFDFYADPTKGDALLLSWAKCDPKDVIFCTSEAQFIEVMGAIYTRLSTEAHKRAAETGEQTG